MKCIEDEIPFEIPQGWEWCRLGSIAMIKGGKRIPKGMGFADRKTNHAYIRVADMTNNSVNLSNLKYISDEVFAHIQNYTVEKNDLYITIAGTIGKVGEIPEALDGMSLTENAAKITSIQVSKSFLCLLLQADFAKKQFNYKTYQVAMPKLGLERIQSVLIPICGTKTQNKIVTSVREILNSIESIRINKAIIIDDIRLSKSRILDLAIRGKLVPQDPNDEPASVLLERIRAEKEELIKQGKIKRDKKESVIIRGEDNSYYLKTGRQLESIDDWGIDMLPDNWELCCLGELCDYGNCVNVETADIDASEWILDLEDIEKDTGRILRKITKKQRNSISTKHRFHSGQVLYSKLRPYLNKVVLTDEDGYCTSEILPLDFAAPLLPSYARYYLMSPTFLAYADRCSYGVKMPRLSTKDGKKAIITVPPLSEQQRIVALIENYFDHINNIAQALS